MCDVAYSVPKFFFPESARFFQRRFRVLCLSRGSKREDPGNEVSGVAGRSQTLKAENPGFRFACVHAFNR